MVGYAGASDPRIMSPPPSASSLPPIRRPPFAHPSPSPPALPPALLRLPSLHPSNLVLTHFSPLRRAPHSCPPSSPLFTLPRSPPPPSDGKIRAACRQGRATNDSCLSAAFIFCTALPACGLLHGRVWILLMIENDEDKHAEIYFLSLPSVFLKKPETPQPPPLCLSLLSPPSTHPLTEQRGTHHKNLPQTLSFRHFSRRFLCKLLKYNR